MYGLAPEKVRPGTSLRTLLTYRKELGTFPGDPEQYCKAILADLATGKATSNASELSDGRVIAVVNQPLPGGAWVSTHQDITELHGAQKDAQQAHERLTAVIDAMPAGLIFYDDQDRLVLSNKYYTDMHAATAEVRVKGACFEDILRAAAAREVPVAASADAEQWIAGRLAAHAAPYDLSEHCYKDGRWLRVQTCRTADGGSIGIHIDISELKRREQELNIQNMRFEAALQNMSQGLAMFDRDRKLVISNDRFAQLYDLPPEMVRPGTDVEEILRHRVANGNIGPDRVDFVQSRMAHVLKGESSDSIVELTDGRLIEVGHRPMADGGWVSTHEDVTERHRADERIAHLARHDTLTSLPNRMRFREYMEAALARVRQGEMMALHCIDLDQFKGINDALGHIAGDALLMQVAARIRSCVRNTDLIARFGGDEFAVVQVAVQGRQEAEILAARIARELSEPYDFNGPLAPISASIGIAMAPTDGMDTDELLRKADIAMYRAKADGRRTFRVSAEAGLPVRRLELGSLKAYCCRRTEDKEAAANLGQLKNLGVAIAMDDFGTGYSSLSSLHRFSFDKIKIKIDRSFIAGLSAGSGAIAIVRAVTSLANSLGIMVTAEGVETQDQLTRLRAEGCHEVQGYLFSPPRPANEIFDVLARCRRLLARAA
jgi:diguanylate cyclase (GGDEF)-like protein